VFCWDFCAKSIFEDQSATPDVVSFVVGRDDLVMQGSARGCWSSASNLRNATFQNAIAHADKLPSITGWRTTAPADAPALTARELMARDWYGVWTVIGGSQWDVRTGNLAVALLTPTKDAAGRVEVNVPRFDGTFTNIRGARVELRLAGGTRTSPSTYTLDSFAALFQGGPTETTSSGTALFTSVPPGDHELELILPEGVTCRTELVDGIEWAWPADAPDLHRVRILPGAVNLVGFVCADHRGSPESPGDGGIRPR
jgi:hypothetical protein